MELNITLYGTKGIYSKYYDLSLSEEKVVITWGLGHFPTRNKKGSRTYTFGSHKDAVIFFCERVTTKRTKGYS